jgi:hypothetical protein
MSNQDNGGPAFPVPAEFFSDGSMRRPSGDGLSIRDYMAAKAMQGLCATLTGAGTPKWDLLAIEAYGMADAMLAARVQQ